MTNLYKGIIIQYIAFIAQKRLKDWNVVVTHSNLATQIIIQIFKMSSFILVLCPLI